MSFRAKREVFIDFNGKHKYKSTPLLYLRPEQEGKLLVAELETLYLEHQVKGSQLHPQLKRSAYQTRKIIPAEKRRKPFKINI